jgi:hypothetical protein
MTQGESGVSIWHWLHGSQVSKARPGAPFDLSRDELGHSSPNSLPRVRLVGIKHSCLAILLFLPLVIGQAQEQTVLLAAHRSGRVEVLDPDTLQSLRSIKVLPLADEITSGSGGLIFLREGLAPDFRGCCALYALDLNTRDMTKVLSPVADIVVSPDGQYLVTQRGNVGIESFDTQTLQPLRRIPRSIAPGVYDLRFSPDGRLLFGASNFPAPTLDIFDFGERTLIRRLALPEDLHIVGAWVGNDYYLYGYHSTTGELWRVNADNSELEAPVRIILPDAPPECGELPEQGLLSAGGRLFLFEGFGGNGDGARCSRKKLTGGVFSVDPQTGRILAHLASDLHFASLISSADGKQLYGVDVRDTTWTSVGLVRLDTSTGEVLSRRDLISDVWSIHLATIPNGRPTGDDR